MQKALSRVLFWTYPRGSWQYDVLCVLIILFIFLTPARVFDRSGSEEAVNSPSTPLTRSETSLGSSQSRIPKLPAPKRIPGE